MLSPFEFYAGTLAQNQLAPSPVKVAAVEDVATEQLAREYYAKSIVDGLQYPTDDARMEDAVKMAAAYGEYVKGELTKAAEYADGIWHHLRTAAMQYIEQHKLADANIQDLLDIAAAQNQSAEEWFVKDYEGTPVKTAASAPGWNAAAVWHGGTPARANLLPESALQHVADLHGVTGPDAKSFAWQKLGLTGKPEDMDHVHGILEQYNTGAHPSIEHASKAYQETLNKPGWLSRNAKWMIPAGLVGAGALYYMKKKRDEENAQ